MGDAFKSEYFKKSPGGIIMLILSIGQIACMTLYLLKGIKDIKKHTHSLYSAYKNYTGKERNNYMADIDGSLELVKNDILYEAQGIATFSSNIREKRMKRGGQSMKYQNQIQKDMVSSLQNSNIA